MSSDETPLTAEALRHAVLERAKRWQVGYSEDDVHRWLDRAADSLQTLSDQLAVARTEIDRIRRWRLDHGAPGESPAAGIQLHVRAQQQAEQLIADARAEAEEILRAARAAPGPVEADGPPGNVAGKLRELTEAIHDQTTLLRRLADRTAR